MQNSAVFQFIMLWATTLDMNGNFELSMTLQKFEMVWGTQTQYYELSLQIKLYMSTSQDYVWRHILLNYTSPKIVSYHGATFY